MGYNIIYIENTTYIPQNFKNTVEEYLKNKSDYKLELLSVANGILGKNKLNEKMIKIKENDNKNIIIICEASIPTAGDANILIKHIINNYTDIEIGVVSRSFSADIEVYPMDSDTTIPAASITSPNSIKRMLKKLFMKLS